MVKILFVPGGYGTYVANCIYSYTSLSSEYSIQPTLLDENGSSHAFRTILQQVSSTIKIGHNIDINDDDLFILIDFSNLHILDYLNNQYKKQHLTINHALKRLIGDEILNKIKINWGYDNLQDTPRWVIREFLSLYIGNIIKQYYKLQYNIPPDISVNTNDLFNNAIIIDIIKQLSHYNIVKTTNDNIIIAHHQNFINAQKYHNSQVKCDRWIDDIIVGRDSISPCQTIFDEAYIQCGLREKGYEIKCDGLDLFPTVSETMNKLLFNRSN